MVEHEPTPHTLMQSYLVRPLILRYYCTALQYCMVRAERVVVLQRLVLTPGVMLYQEKWGAVGEKHSVFAVQPSHGTVPPSGYGLRRRALRCWYRISGTDMQNAGILPGRSRIVSPLRRLTRRRTRGSQGS